MDRYIEFATNHWMLSVGVIVVLLLLIYDFIDTALQKFNKISPMNVVNLMNNSDIVVVDIREAHEYAKGHIENAINLPIGKLDEKLGEVEKFKQTPLVVTCQTGTRSVTACKKFTKQGFEKIFLLTGGYQSWEENNLPVKKDKK